MVVRILKSATLHVFGVFPNHIWTWNTPKPWQNRVFSWLACTTLDSQSDFHVKVDWLSRVVVFCILLCGFIFHAKIVKL